MMIGLVVHNDRIHDRVSTAAGPRQLGNRHVLRQAGGRWRAPHAIPASPPQPTVRHFGLGHTAQTVGRSGKQLTPPPSLPVPPAQCPLSEVSCNPPSPVCPSSWALSSEP